MKTWLIKMMIGAPLNFEQVRTYVLTRIHNDKQKPYAQGLYEQTNCLSVEHELNVLRKISKYISLKKTRRTRRINLNFVKVHHQKFRFKI